MTLKDFGNIEYETIFADEEPKYAYMLTDDQVKEHEDNMIKLQNMLLDLKIKDDLENDLKASDYSNIEMNCLISSETFRKVICGKHKVTRELLYKIVVGYKMTLDEANEYFELEGGKLNPKCLADHICIGALEGKDKIEVFVKEYKDLTGKAIVKKERAENKKQREVEKECQEKNKNKEI